MKVANRIDELQRRGKVQKHEKIVTDRSGSNVVKAKVIDKYEYYICDYCQSEIRILNEKHKHKQLGGTITIPDSLTSRGRVELALCTKCLKLVVREFEERLREQRERRK